MDSLSVHNPASKHNSEPPLIARKVLQLLNKLSHGSLSLHLPNGQVANFGDGKGVAVSATMLNWKPFQAAWKSGDIGFAETYIQGDWTTNQLPALLRLLSANRSALDSVIHGTWAGRFLYRLKHLLRRNTPANSRKNIHAHYDLGNEFYRLWLDPTMNYSSAFFNGDFNKTLSQAQDAKVARALQRVQVQPGDRLLEIGCGWGALAEAASRDYGVAVTGVTLSKEQLSWAQERLASQGLNLQGQLRLQDYRDIDDGPYDAICSIEMLEAVGKEYWSTYFQALARLLKPQGRACIQSIVIQDHLFDRYIQSTDFIQQYIFPGGCLPSPQTMQSECKKAGLDLVDVHMFGSDYAQTCRRWRTSFLAKRDQVLALGFDERFIRIWEFYLAYCEAGFDQGDISVAQYTLVKP